MPLMANVEIIVRKGKQKFVLEAQPGDNLRKVLLRNNLSPYGSISRNLNCSGRGLCATCGVRIRSGKADATHWHDKIGRKFGYPALSCKIWVQEPLEIRLLTDKKMWGKREK